jgi:hypothetical protein
LSDFCLDVLLVVGEEPIEGSFRGPQNEGSESAIIASAPEIMDLVARTLKERNTKLAVYGFQKSNDLMS